MSEERPPAVARVRVTAPRPGEPLHPLAEASGADGADAASVYTSTLIRSQLRLALLCAGGFVLVLIVIGAVAAFAPGLDELLVGGVPASWLVLGFAGYPPMIAIAAIYVAAAGRNEAGYRRLNESS